LRLKYSFIIGIVLIALLSTSIYATVGMETAEARKMIKNHSESPKQKIPESIKKIFKTEKTK